MQDLNPFLPTCFFTVIELSRHHVFRFSLRLQ